MGDRNPQGASLFSNIDQNTNELGGNRQAERSQSPNMPVSDLQKSDVQNKTNSTLDQGFSDTYSDHSNDLQFQQSEWNYDNPFGDNQLIITADDARRDRVTRLMIFMKKRSAERCHICQNGRQSNSDLELSDVI